MRDQQIKWDSSVSPPSWSQAQAWPGSLGQLQQSVHSWPVRRPGLISGPIGLGERAPSPWPTLGSIRILQPPLVLPRPGESGFFSAPSDNYYTETRTV